MGGEGGTTDDGVGLAQANHVAKGGRKIVEKALEEDAGEFRLFKIHGEKGRGQAQKEEFFPQGGVFAGGQFIAMHGDAGVCRQKSR